MIWKQMSAWITMVGVGKIKEPILLHEGIRSMGECVNAPWLMVCNSKEMVILFVSYLIQILGSTTLMANLQRSQMLTCLFIYMKVTRKILFALWMRRTLLNTLE
ncbi:hypothetical protein K1719_046755 [Acacia pycnantha]|nr:hypothetical protein K1719_046755 [Acacia pycnantha]